MTNNKQQSSRRERRWSASWNGLWYWPLPICIREVIQKNMHEKNLSDKKSSENWKKIFFREEKIFLSFHSFHRWEFMVNIVGKTKRWNSIGWSNAPVNVHDYILTFKRISVKLLLSDNWQISLDLFRIISVLESSGVFACVLIYVHGVFVFSVRIDR